jgi:hypothetical protein
MTLEDIHITRFLSGLEEVTQEEEKEDSEPDNYLVMERFINQHLGALKLSDPLIIAMCDVIEEKLEYDEEDEYSVDILNEETSQYLPIVRQIIVS